MFHKDVYCVLLDSALVWNSQVAICMFLYQNHWRTSTHIITAYHEQNTWNIYAVHSQLSALSSIILSMWWNRNQVGPNNSIPVSCISLAWGSALEMKCTSLTTWPLRKVKRDRERNGTCSCWRGPLLFRRMIVCGIMKISILMIKPGSESAL